jgi:hypothetical protein
MLSAMFGVTVIAIALIPGSPRLTKALPGYQFINSWPDIRVRGDGGLIL